MTDPSSRHWSECPMPGTDHTGCRVCEAHFKGMAEAWEEGKAAGWGDAKSVRLGETVDRRGMVYGASAFTSTLNPYRPAKGDE